MQTIQGFYDGKTFVPLEKVPVSKKYKVIITFVEEIDEAEEVRNLSTQTDGFKFWEDTAEDVYQDYLDRK